MNSDRCIRFASQLGRKENFIKGKGPHEGRFEIINDSPAISSKYKKIPKICFNKERGHSFNIFPVASTSPTYYPKFHLVDQRKFHIIIGLNKGSIEFNKMSKRTIKLENEPPYIRDTIDPIKVSNTLKIMGKRSQIVKFNKQLKLEDKGKLPRFLLVKLI